ncbi:MAG TPA: GFA family protein [bacterium]|nr:GFA family protein [bacterium]
MSAGNGAAHEGGCLCGAVRYSAQGEPVGVEYCHCSMCRRASGAPVVVWATYAAEAVAFTQGRPAEYASSANGRRGFCNRCGGALTFRWQDRPGEIDVTVGSLDEPQRFAPGHHIYDADRLPWLTIADDLPRYPASKPK